VLKPVFGQLPEPLALQNGNQWEVLLNHYWGVVRLISIGWPLSMVYTLEWSSEPIQAVGLLKVWYVIKIASVIVTQSTRAHSNFMRSLFGMFSLLRWWKTNFVNDFLFWARWTPLTSVQLVSWIYGEMVKSPEWIQGHLFCYAKRLPLKPTPNFPMLGVSRRAWLLLAVTLVYGLSHLWYQRAALLHHAPNSRWFLQLDKPNCLGGRCSSAFCNSS